MLKSHSRPAPTGGRPRLRLAALALLLVTTAPPVAAAAPVSDALQPLGIVGNASRPSCDGALAPLEPTDVVGDVDEYEDSAAATPARVQISATAYAFEFLPTVRLCSPTFSGIPGPIGGTIVAAPRRTRLGRGWRELGGTFVQPAALTPGDAITLPEVDDAATVRLSVARSNDLPTSTISLADLAPGPSTVTIAEDARGLVATLVRADGSATEGVAKPLVTPPIAATLSGTRKRWSLGLTLLPGSFAYASVYSYDGGYDEGSLTGTTAADGSTRFVIRPTTRRKPRRVSVRLIGIATNREAHTFTSFSCELTSTKQGLPTKPSCRAGDSDGLFDDNDVESPFDDWGALRGPAREFLATAGRSVARAAHAVGLPRLAGPSTSTPAQSKGPVAHRNAVMGRAASRVAAAPIVAREIARSAGLGALGFQAPRPLGGDVNGDGAPDFWTDEAPEGAVTPPPLLTTAGFLLLSSPGGLVARRVDLPSSTALRSFGSEISAVADVTGDGIGELVIDLNERHALIPGSRAWTTSPAPIRAPLPDDLGPNDILLQPSASSPGAPYAAIDDASGDGRRDLVGTDDLGGFYAVASSDLRGGTTTRLPTVTRAVPVPRPVKAALTFEPAAPRVDPRVRVIAGQAIALRWPTIASVKAPEGAVEIAVRTGTGAAVRPPITVRSAGNAVLLDYDRVSGDVLLLSVAARCTVGRNYLRGRCRETFLRVRADGSLRQSLTVDPRASITYVGAARFIADGPDADGDTDVVLTVGNSGLALAESTRTGPLAEASLPVSRIVAVDRPFYDELRPIPVVDPSGARTLTIALPIEMTSGRNAWSGGDRVPAVIGWK